MRTVRNINNDGDHLVTWTHHSDGHSNWHQISLTHFRKRHNRERTPGTACQTRGKAQQRTPCELNSASGYFTNLTDPSLASIKLERLFYAKSSGGNLQNRKKNHLDRVLRAYINWLGRTRSQQRCWLNKIRLTEQRDTQTRPQKRT